MIPTLSASINRYICDPAHAEAQNHMRFWATANHAVVELLAYDIIAD